MKICDIEMNNILFFVGLILASIAVYFDPKGYSNGMGIGMMLVALAHMLSFNWKFRKIEK